MDELNHLGWVVQKSYDVAGHLLGIRTNSEVCGEWLDATLSKYETDEETEPYFSLWLPDEEGFGRGYYVLYKEGTEAFRTLNPALLALRLVQELDRLAFRTR